MPYIHQTKRHNHHEIGKIYKVEFNPDITKEEEKKQKLLIDEYYYYDQEQGKVLIDEESFYKKKKVVEQEPSSSLLSFEEKFHQFKTKNNTHNKK